MQPAISTRPSNPSDAEFFYRVVATTMKESVTFAFGEWNDQQVRTEALDFGKSPHGRVIERDGTPVGILLVVPEDSHLYVRLICVAETAQGGGIGAVVMREVLAAAAKQSLPVRLRALLHGGAKGFYEKLGFRVTEATPKFAYMEHAP